MSWAFRAAIPIMIDDHNSAPRQPETLLSHAGCDRSLYPNTDLTPGHLPPVQMSVNFAAPSMEVAQEAGPWGDPGYAYARLADPTGDILARELARLEGGERALLFGSGMGAISAALFGLTRAGDHVLASRSLYSGTRSLLDRVLPRFGVEVTYFDPVAPIAEIEPLLKPNTRVIFAEPITNPLIEVMDIPALGALARAHGALLVLDSTLTPPPFYRPLAGGAHVNIHSLTKYINGHGDVLGGAVIGDKAEIVAIRAMLVSLGSCLPPMGSYLVMRGLRTMHVRVQRSFDSALELARWLETHPEVTRVSHPGLPSHPQHQLALKLFGTPACTGLFSFEHRRGEAGARAAIKSVRIFSFAASLGEPNSLIEYPPLNQYGHLRREDKRAFGLPDTLLRVAIGIENPADLRADLDQALRSA